MSDKYLEMTRQLKDANRRFQDVLRQETDEYIRDSAIKRFEFTFELAWKTMKAYLDYKGIKAFAPRDIIKNAFAARIIPQDTIWLEMLNTRNLTAHVYNEGLANNVYKKIQHYPQYFTDLIDSLNKI